MNEIKCYFKKIHLLLEAGFTRALRSYGLTCTQFDILAYLAQEKDVPHTLTAISTHFGVKHTSVIHVLKILEKNGFIYKSASADARAKTILLTSHAHQVLAELRKNSPLLNEILFAGLSEDDLHRLERMLRQIYANLESDAFQNF
ncbi:MAG: MarR family winged helix-turn-helix transcriptional regulator [Eubacterium sp.]|nr:MarR family winged helix-turn-helix transcriptional regulator [Eubacterium sp.]